MSHYSPFGSVSLADLKPAELARLRDAHEGWYIEYKRHCPAAPALAKSLSAFANTYGGWLFLGIAEKSKDEAVAGAFPGLTRDEVDPCLQRLRKCAADHLNPTPHFDVVVLWGPEPTIGLLADHGVICVSVPQSASAPHVHSSGQIYRRVSGASEPRPETDRFVLDQLWRRGDDVKRQHEEWLARDPEFSKSEESQPYVRLMLIADRWYERDILIERDDDVRAALGQSVGLSAIPFDTVYTAAGGFVGRQLKNNDPQNLVMTWRLQRNLASDVIIPLPLYEAASIEMLELQLHSYKYILDFTSLLRRHTFSLARVVDLNYLFNILVGVAATQERLCGVAGWTENYHMKARLLNVWRTIPFVDVQAALQRFASHGLPMSLDSTTSIPSGAGPTKYIEVDRHPEIADVDTRSLGQAMRMFAPLALAFGVPPWLSAGSTEELEYLQDLQEAGHRAIDVQRLRNVARERK